jgi:hypothetical protein
MKKINVDIDSEDFVSEYHEISVKDLSKIKKSGIKINKLKKFKKWD